MHGVGDGAPWIANRMEEQFGNKVVYLIDFYHLCEYLSAAAPLCATKDEEVRWLDKQKARLKQSKAFEVLLALQPHVEGQDIVEEKAPVRVIVISKIACINWTTKLQLMKDYLLSQVKLKVLIAMLFKSG